MKPKFLLVLVAILMVVGCKAEPEIPAELEVWVDESLDMDAYTATDPLVLHFNQPMDPESVETPLKIFPDVMGEYTWSEDHTTLTFTPSPKFISRNYYSVTLQDGLASISGMTFEKTPRWRLRVDFGYNTYYAEPRSRNLDLDKPEISITFKDEEVDTDSVTAALTVSPASLETSASWKGNVLTIQIEPESGVQPDTEVVVEIGEGAKTVAGRGFAEKSWTFSSEPLEATISGPEGFDRSAPIAISFNYPMDPDSPEGGIAMTPELSFTPKWEDGDKTLVLEVNEPFPFGETITITLGRPLQTANKYKIKNPIELTYQTPSLIASIETTRLEGGEVEVQYDFSVDLDKESVEAAFSISPKIPYRTEWEGEAKFTVISEDYLLPETRFRFVLAGEILDAEGLVAQVNETYVYESGPPVEISGQTKYDYSRDEEVYAPQLPLDLLFYRPVDRESLRGAVSFEPETAFEIDWVSGKHAQLIPQPPFLELTEYQITIEPSLLDADGEPVLLEAYTSTFYTGNYADAISFGLRGANVQVVDLDASRLIEVGRPEGPYQEIQEADTIQVELVRLTMAEMIDYLQFSAGRRSYSSSPPIYDTSGLGVQAAWEVTLEEINNAFGEEGGSWGIQLPEELSEGLYIMNLTTDHVNDQLAVVATRASIVVKVGEYPDGNGQVLAWVHNINSYMMQDTDVWVFDEEGTVIASGETDEVGMFEAAFSPDKAPYVVMARQGETITISGVGGQWQNWRSFWWDDFLSTWFDTPVGDDYLVYTYTERPIYRPGQEVFYKGVAREDFDANYSLPPLGKEVEVTLKDGRGNRLTTETATLNAFGTFNGSFQLAEGGMLGDYSIEVEIDGEVHEQAFKVQEYKKPDITVNVTTEEAVYVRNDTVKVTVNTAYLFGEPIANAEVTLNVFELAPSSYNYWWYYAEDEDELPVESMTWFETDFSEVSATTDENGIVEFTIQAPIGKLNPYYYYDYYYDDASTKQYSSTMGIEATVDDGSDQFVSGFSTIKVFSSSAQIKLNLNHWVYEIGNPVFVDAWYFSEIEESVAGQNLKLVVEKGDPEYYRSYETYKTLELETDEDGLARVELELEEPGRYRLTLSGVDGRGNTLKRSRYFYLKGDEDNSWWANYYQDLTVSTNQDEMRPGETAQIMVETGFDGEGLLTVERGGVYETRVVQLTAPVTVVEVPIKAAYAPNVYVTVQVWEPIDRLALREGDYYYYLSTAESKLRMDTVEIEVADIQHELSLTFSSDKDTYLPREEATFAVEVSDYLGRPVVAEVSLGLVDEAIYLLSEEVSSPIHESFYQPRPWGVLTSDSMSPERWLYVPGMGGGGDGDITGDGGNPRSEFPDTVVWYPTITTNESGKAEITITLPDTLTTWRLTGKAVTKDTLVGDGNYTVITQQPVVVRPLLPGVVTEGDAFLLSAVVHNFGEEADSFRVTVESENLAVGAGEEEVIELEAGESQVVVWQARAEQPGETAVTVKAKSEQYADAVQMTFPVVPLVITSHWVESGRFSGEVDVPVAIPEEALPESRVVVQVNRTISDSLLDGVEYLTGFPYGCVEETMSRALPNAVVARALNQLGLGDRVGAFQLNEKIAASIQRLYAYQHTDGGWGWWFDDPSDGYQTAWVLYGLSLTGEAGYSIDEEVLADGAAYLESHLEEMNLPTRAYALYALSIAGHGNVEEALLLTGNFQDLDTFSQAALVLTLYDLGETDQAESLMDTILLDLTSETEGSAYIPGEDYDGYYHKKFMSSEVRSNAMVLKALLEINPKSSSVHDLANWLMNKRSHHGWGTTNETAFSLVALSDYILIERLGEGSETVVLSVNGEDYGEEVLSEGKPAAEFSVPVEEVISGENLLTLSSDSTSPVYYLVDVEMITRIPPGTGQGIEITRSYYPVGGKKPQTEFEEGELVRVRITVKVPEDSFYIMIEDPLPGGLTALNENLNITVHDAVTGNRPDYDSSDFFRWQDYGYNNKEVYPDKVVFFVSEIKKGTYEIEYLARATVAGEFTAMPAVVSAMYQPSFFGRSAANEVVVLGPGN